LGPPVAVVPGDQNLVAVYNLGIPGADAYRGDNTSAMITGGNVVTIAPKQFPFASPANRFQIIAYPVTYVCDKGAHTLTRFWNYAIQIGQPTSFSSSAQHALLATNVSDCSFTYNPQVIMQRAGLVSIWLQLTELTESSESVSLYHEVHVSNVP